MKEDVPGTQLLERLARLDGRTVTDDDERYVRGPDRLDDLHRTRERGVGCDVHHQVRSGVEGDVRRPHHRSGIEARAAADHPDLDVLAGCPLVDDVLDEGGGPDVACLDEKEPEPVHDVHVQGERRKVT